MTNPQTEALTIVAAEGDDVEWFHPDDVVRMIATALAAKDAELERLRQNEKDYEAAYSAGVEWMTRTKRAEADNAQLVEELAGSQTREEALRSEIDKLRALAERAGGVKVKAQDAAKVARLAATEMIAQKQQWRLDPAYIITLCDEIDRLSALTTEPAASERTCATCHAVLADGPQPFATYDPAALAK